MNLMNTMYLDGLEEQLPEIVNKMDTFDYYMKWCYSINRVRP